MADLWVMNSQKWVNTKYASVSGVPHLTEDGVTGWGTMYALTRALQHELGITALSDSFGPATQSAYASKVGSITKSSKANLIGILQCALWCKGYTGGTTIGTWDDVIAVSIGNVRTDIGLAAGNAVDVKLMKSLLTLDAYIRVGSGTDVIRAGQQWLNSRYTNRADFFIIPTDGRYTRDVQKGLMLAIQYEIGMADGVANGALFGPGTQAGLRDQAMLSSGSTDGSKRFVSLFQLALAFNGYNVPRTGTFAVSTRTTTLDFQRFMEIAASGTADFDTWAALLVSTGNPNRAVTGMDTTTALTPASAAARYKEGYRVVGRYLTVEGKSIAAGELDVIFDAGFALIPIFQNYNNGPQYFTRSLGLDHGKQAAIRARQLGLRNDVTIFFAVDYDAFETEIERLVVPYFEGVRDGLSSSVSITYKVGIYATRNVSAKIADRGLASSVWVSGMSTGYSGNLGYPMPKNWSYNQIQEIKLINIDRNAVSVRARPATRNDVLRTPDGTAQGRRLFFNLTAEVVKAERTTISSATLSADLANELVLDHMMSASYHDGVWLAYAPYVETTGIPSGTAGAIAGARRTYLGDAKPVKEIVDDYEGDLEHMCATTRGALLYGLAPRSSVNTIGDLGGWALDLVQLWASYRKQNQLSIEKFIAQELGKPGAPTGFDEADVIADADGWLVARAIRNGAQLDVALAAILRQPWKSRLSQFLEGRFGSEVTARAAVLDVFLGGWVWTRYPREHFLAGEDGPSASTEAEPLADAVVARLYELASD